MTLHGDIRINGRRIGGWAAQRRHLNPTRGSECLYDCEVWTEESRFQDDGARFAVAHDPMSGALGLASAVLRAAHEALPTTEVTP